jgi:hypothetical protein
MAQVTQSCTQCLGATEFSREAEEADPHDIPRLLRARRERPHRRRTAERR